MKKLSFLALFVLLCSAGFAQSARPVIIVKTIGGSQAEKTKGRDGLLEARITMQMADLFGEVIAGIGKQMVRLPMDDRAPRTNEVAGVAQLIFVTSNNKPDIAEGLSVHYNRLPVPDNPSATFATLLGGVLNSHGVRATVIPDVADPKSVPPAFPVVTVSLGNLQNTADLAHMQDKTFLTELSRMIADALIRYSMTPKK